MIQHPCAPTQAPLQATTKADRARQRRDSLRAELAAQDLSWEFYSEAGCVHATGTQAQFIAAGLLPDNHIWPARKYARDYWSVGQTTWILKRATSDFLKRLGRTGEQWTLVITAGLDSPQLRERLISRKVDELARLMLEQAQNPAWQMLREAHFQACSDARFQSMLGAILAPTEAPRGRRPVTQNTQEQA